MAFRDIRNLTEMLRVLGYPHLVSVNSFRNPNFPLVADLLIWLAKRFDPDADIPTEIETVDERVDFIRTVAEFMATKADIKLNTKRLYQADGYVVKELLKITSMLHEALKSNPVKQEDIIEEDFSLNMRDYDLSTKVDDLKQSRNLASEITLTGAKLFDLLGKEVDIKGIRQRSLARQLEVGQVETAIRETIEETKKEIEETKQLIDNVAATEASLDAKIERRKVEIDRYEKRLQTLKKVRPAFMDEFGALEKELEELFVQYSTRLRCLNYLERLAADAERAHLQRQQLAATKRAVEVVPLDTSGDNADMLSLEEGLEEQKTRPERPRASTGGRTRNDRAKMDQTFSNSETSLDLSSETESEDVFMDRDGVEAENSDDESLGLELSGMEKLSSGRKTSNKLQNNSDDDF